MSPARVARASLSSIQARRAHTAHTPVLTVIKTLGPLCCFSIALLHPLKSHFGRQAADQIAVSPEAATGRVRGVSGQTRTAVPLAEGARAWDSVFQMDEWR